MTSSKYSFIDVDVCTGCTALHHVAAKACETEVAFNATFQSVLEDFHSGKCLDGFGGSITRPCLYNATSDEAYWGETDGSCSGISPWRAAPLDIGMT